MHIGVNYLTAKAMENKAYKIFFVLVRVTVDLIVFPNLN